MRALYVVERKTDGEWKFISMHRDNDFETGRAAAHRVVNGMFHKEFWRVVKYVPAPAKKRGK